MQKIIILLTIYMCSTVSTGCEIIDSDSDGDSDSDSESDPDSESDSDTGPECDTYPNFESDQKYNGPCIANIDWYDGEDKYGEGLPDCTVNRRTINEYDDQGRLIIVENDQHATGNIYGRTTYTYDDYDNVVTMDTDGGYSGNGSLYLSNGIIDNRWSYNYDSQGNQLTVEYDIGFDDLVDQRTSRIFDDQGQMLTEEVDWGTENEDSGADGIIDRRYIYTYDDYGNKLTYESDGGSEPADGITDYSESFAYTYDVNNNVVAQEIYLNNDDFPFSLTTYTYDETDNVLTIDYREYVDFEAGDYHTIYTYDSDNNVVTFFRNSTDSNTRMNYTYDDFGNLVLATYDYTNDHSEHWESHSQTIYTYDCWAGWED